MRIARRVVGRLARTLLGTITNIETTEPLVALTFDDGPDPESTPRMLDILERYGAHGTFFMIGEKAAQYPDLVGRVASGGHAIGNHTWNHSSFPLLNRQERFVQLRRCAEALAPHASRMFRPPYGSQDDRSRFDLALAGYQVVTWSVLEPDWLDREPEAIATRIEGKIQSGSIVLLHDALHDALKPEYFSRENTLGAVELLLERIKGRFRFVTVPELMRHGRAQRTMWRQAPDTDFLKQLKNKAGVTRSYQDK